jgi:hypothetical protein
MTTGGCSKQGRVSVAAGWILFVLVTTLLCLLGVAAMEPKDLHQFHFLHQNKRVDAKALMEDVCTKNFRPAADLRTFRSKEVDSAVVSLCKKLKQKDPHLAFLFANTFPNTLDSSVSVFEEEDPLAFIVSDGRSMSLRSSTWQARPYLRFAKKDPHLQALLKGVVKAQVLCLASDIYANNCEFSSPLSVSSRNKMLIDRWQVCFKQEQSERWIDGLSLALYHPSFCFPTSTIKPPM